MKHSGGKVMQVDGKFRLLTGWLFCVHSCLFTFCRSLPYFWNRCLGTCLLSSIQECATRLCQCHMAHHRLEECQRKIQGGLVRQIWKKLDLSPFEQTENLMHLILFWSNKALMVQAMQLMLL